MARPKDNSKESPTNVDFPYERRGMGNGIFRKDRKEPTTKEEIETEIEQIRMKINDIENKGWHKEMTKSSGVYNSTLYFAKSAKMMPAGSSNPASPRYVAQRKLGMGHAAGTVSSTGKIVRDFINNIGSFGSFYHADRSYAIGEKHREELIQKVLLSTRQSQLRDKLDRLNNKQNKSENNETNEKAPRPGK